VTRAWQWPTWRARWSLRARIAALSTSLLAAIGVFMVAFFPPRMVAQARHAAIERGAAIANVMAIALAPAVEFDDPQNATAVLTSLAAAGEVQFGVLRRADGSVLAAWRGEHRPAGAVPAGAHVEGELVTFGLVVTGQAGAAGRVEVGVSLAHLAKVEADTTRTVILATIVVVLLGGLASALIGSLVVRPIRQLTHTARRISRGELPPRMPVPEGGDEVAQMAESLSVMLERLDQANQLLLKASRHAGMAEVATGVLHNVGNVLTSVNVTVELMHERIRAMPLDRLRRLEELLAASDGGPLDGERREAVRRYLALVGDDLDRGREDALRDFTALRGHLEHIKRVVAMQNTYARAGGVQERVALRALIDEAIEMGCPAAARRGIELLVKCADAELVVDRHRVLQIVVNLITNARDAVLAVEGARRITIRGSVDAEVLELRVADTGAGISPKNLYRMFTAGFTTKPQGHDYGLHSSGLAARTLGGELSVASTGLGQGATFTLTVPLAHAAAEASPDVA
jgi:signal transduction histidine kinase